jgi:hypothetical protein
MRYPYSGVDLRKHPEEYLRLKEEHRRRNG